MKSSQRNEPKNSQQKLRSSHHKALVSNEPKMMAAKLKELTSSNESQSSKEETWFIWLYAKEQIDTEDLCLMDDRDDVTSA